MNIKEILPHLYRVRIPLPDSPLLYLNSYVVKASPRSLIIDTGMNRPECLKEMTASLQELSIDPEQSDYFITHLHADHIGLVGNLAGASSKVYFNRFETPELATPNLWWDRLNRFAGVDGFPREDLSVLLDAHPASRYYLKRIPEITVLHEGDILTAGDYSFRFIETPGHSPGHACLYDADHKLLISGDHILSDISSNITTRYNSGTNAIADYLQSLDKVYSLDVELVLPGHRNIITDMRKRIDELKQHHENRLNEQLEILKNGDQNAYQVTAQMTWDIDYKHWDALPVFQKYFAFAEGLAHLQYLASIGKVNEKTISGGCIVYSL